MKSPLNFLLKFLGFVFIILLILFVINQVSTIFLLANNIHPTLGKIVLISLIVLFSFLFIVPLILYLKYPSAEQLQNLLIDLSSLENQKKIKQLLIRNPHLKSTNYKLDSEQDILDALAFLDTKADNILKNTASTIFIATAISQNGKLDGIMVLVSHIKMIWEITKVYYHRPMLKHLYKLYSNIAATTFLVVGIEDLQIEEQLEPIITSTISTSLIETVPGIRQTASLVTASILEGAANAFLTLRVGIMTRDMISSKPYLNRNLLRRSATLQAAPMLTSIVMKSSTKISKSIIKATQKAGKKAVLSSGTAIKNLFRKSENKTN